MNATRKWDRQVIHARFVLPLLLLFAGIPLFAEPQTSNEVLKARTIIKLIRSPEIQSELSIDAQQLKAIAPMVDEIDLSLWPLRNLPVEQSNETAHALKKQLGGGLAGLLRPNQVKRLDQLILRLEGWRTIQLPSVVDQLNLTDPQKEKYTAFLSEMQNLKGKTLKDVSLSEFEWIRNVLTMPQRQKLNQLLGKPFDFSRLTIVEAKAPEIVDVEHWINSPPLKLADLRGKVVLVNFWSFGCVNCIHNLPHYKKWHAQLPKDRVAMIAFHTPETQEESDFDNLRKAVKERGLEYPIAVDNGKENWKAWGNDVWPSVYLIDKQGFVRFWWYGELNWQGATGEKQMWDRIHQLLAEKESEAARISPPPAAENNSVAASTAGEGADARPNIRMPQGDPH